MHDLRRNDHRDETYTKKQKKLAKIKIDFFDLFGVGGFVRRCFTSFFLTGVPF